jgi:hypothetical protein
MAAARHGAPPGDKVGWQPAAPNNRGKPHAAPDLTAHPAKSSTSDDLPARFDDDRR